MLCQQTLYSAVRAALGDTDFLAVLEYLDACVAPILLRIVMEDGWFRLPGCKAGAPQPGLRQAAASQLHIHRMQRKQVMCVAKHLYPAGVDGDEFCIFCKPRTEVAENRHQVFAARCFPAEWLKQRHDLHMERMQITARQQSHNMWRMNGSPG